jgi:hypothetical protein
MSPTGSSRSKSPESIEGFKTFQSFKNRTLKGTNGEERPKPYSRQCQTLRAPQQTWGFTYD